MKQLIVLAIVAACSKAKDPAPAPPPRSAGSAEAEPERAAGLSVVHAVPEFSGTYDNVFARFSDADHQTVVAFVRDCPALTCEVGAWESEQVAHVCPKAYIATARIPSLAKGRFKIDMIFAGPAENASTATLESVSVELTTVGNDGVAGSARQKTTESTVDGRFKARVCPRT